MSKIKNKTEKHQGIIRYLPLYRTNAYVTAPKKDVKNTAKNHIMRDFFDKLLSRTTCTSTTIEKIKDIRRNQLTTIPQ